MRTFRADLALLGLAVVGVLADLACVLTGHPAPELFQTVALAGLTGAAGVALPPSNLVPQAPAPAPAPAPSAAADVAGISGPVGA